MIIAPVSTIRDSGMSGIWGDLMTFTTNIYDQKTQVSIQQSHAEQAVAQARIAEAAAIAAQHSKLNANMMWLIAAGLGGAFLLTRKL